ncbi:hypothetical protein B7P43_G10208 [Cryptotermes secundus]|uniref:Uncharacterized protein n=1 Tax=Cryptotermes secundus TaxID=105785 RepID=A0A2J7RDD0_9NEOP|nr:hypothetical protein B7P43_G10208 [Cryptotermes secundus]
MPEKCFIIQCRECCVHSPYEQCWSGITEEVAVLSDGGCGTQLTASMKVLPHAPLMDTLYFASGKDRQGDPQLPPLDVHGMSATNRQIVLFV